MKIKNILGAAVVAVAGISASPTVGAEPVASKNKIEKLVKSEAGVNNMDLLSKSLFQEHKNNLNKIGADNIEIASSEDSQKLAGGTVSANGMTAITIKFMKNGIAIPGYQTTIMTMTSEIKNKFDLRELLTKNIKDMFRKENTQTAVSNGGISINASGNANVLVNGPGNNNLKVESSGTKGRININGKDATPEGVDSGPMTLETINGVLHINGKPVKR